MDPMELEEIRELAKRMSIRAIAKKLGRDVKTIRAALGRPAQETAPSQLEPFKDLVRELAAKDLFGPRILREIRERGYTGGRTMLGDFLRSIRPAKKSNAPVRRFETKKAK